MCAIASVEFSGTATGLSAETKSHIVDGVVGIVTSFDRATDRIVVARQEVWSAAGADVARIAQSNASTPILCASKRALTVTYPAQSCSPGDTYNGNTPATVAFAGSLRPSGGNNFSVKIPKCKRATVKYAVKFPVGFDFRLGGKLPGLSSDSMQASGGNYQVGGVSSFTARHMWQADGVFIPYFYMADNFDRWGIEYGSSIGAIQAAFTPGQWGVIETSIWLNDVGVANGGAVVRLNGLEVANRSDLTWRLNDNLHIERLWFSTFFGGNTKDAGDDTYETLVDTSVQFSDFLIQVG